MPDGIEEYISSDPNNIDTDGDGLNDYYEVFGTFTDPTKADTDDNGVNDDDEDFDEDGLTNLEEFEKKTNPYIADTDSDGLSDGDEVKTHGTDPLVADTDGDGLEDGDEIVLGTNPLVQDTDGDGIIDSEEKYQQTFTHKVKNDDCAVTEVIVDMECTGNINRTTSVESVMNVDILCTDVVGLVGEPFEIETKSEFDKATLTFKINKDKLGGISFDNLLFLWYNEEEDEFVELETTLDEVNGTVSISTTHFSKYMIVDKKEWFDAWSIQFNYNPSSDSTHYEPGGSYPTIKFNTALTIDCSGSMSWNDPTSQRIEAANKFIDYMHSGDKISVVFFTDFAQLIASMTNDESALRNSLNNVYSRGGTNFSVAINKAISSFAQDDIKASYVNNRIILLSDGDDGGSTSALNNALNACVDKKIKIFTVGLGSANDSILQRIADKTGGEYFKAFSYTDLVDIFAELGYVDDFDMTDTDGDGLPDAVEAAGIRLPNGRIIRGCDQTNPDTDGDGLLDGEEIDPKPTFINKKNDSIWNFVVFDVVQGYSFVMKSDPTKKDTDGDGYDDESEVNEHGSDPLNCDVFNYSLSNESYVSINNGQYYGGNQSWFSMYNYDISCAGCGLIAAADSLIYLEQNNTGFSGITGIENVDRIDSISMDDYSFYINKVYNYITPTPIAPTLSAIYENITGEYYTAIGILPYKFSSGLISYLSDHGIHATIDYVSKRHSAINVIIDELKMDIPVYGYVLSLDKKDTIWCKLETHAGKDEDKSFLQHWIVVTGVSIDNISGEKTLIFSTWGEKGRLDYEKYYSLFNFYFLTF